MKFQVIPVIDVRHGTAVKAVAGDRASYAPLVTPLAPTSHPADVACGLMALASFPVIYVADLDGIEGRDADAGLAAKIVAATGARVWLDSGLPPIPAIACAALSDCGPMVSHVLGTESQWNCAALATLAPEQRATSILSLDFRGEMFVGDADLLDRPDLWPVQVIVMTLAAVGGNAGPDWRRLEQVAGRAAGHAISVYAAGGIRHRHDLDRLAEMGVSGALVASALHAGTITAADLG